MTFIYSYPTIIGNICAEATDDALTHLYFACDKIPEGREIGETPVMKEARKQLDAYFSQKLKYFSLPLNPEGTPFMKQIWQLLCEIPYGQTTTYGQLAEKAGMPHAARVVGLANNRNPLPIFIPCHRVVGAKGALTGYRGGLDVKKTLLNLEMDRSFSLFG